MLILRHAWGFAAAVALGYLLVVVYLGYAFVHLPKWGPSDAPIHQAGSVGFLGFVIVAHILTSILAHMRSRETS